MAVIDGHTENPNPPVLGYVACKRCGTAVLDVVAFKTDGHCADCFRAHANEILNPVMVVVAGREKIVLRTKRVRTPGDKAQRKRAKQDPERRAKAKLVADCHRKATKRLRAIFPELWEILLADERAKADLDAWTIDRAVTPGECSSSLEMLRAYYHTNREATE